MSLAIVDPNVSEVLYSTTVQLVQPFEYVGATLVSGVFAVWNSLTNFDFPGFPGFQWIGDVVYSSFWFITNWCCVILERVQDGFTYIGYNTTSFMHYGLNSVTLGSIYVFNLIFKVFIDFCAFFTLLIPTFERSTEVYPEAPVIQESPAMVLPDYDALANQIIDSTKFQQFINDLSDKKISGIRTSLSDIIEDNFKQLVDNLDDTNSLLKLDQSQMDVQNQIKDLKQSQEMILNQLKLDQSALQTALDDLDSMVKAKMEEDATSQEDLGLLAHKIKIITDEISRLDVLAKACCSSNEDQIIDYNEFVVHFFESQKTQFITREEFELGLSRMVIEIHQRLTDQSKQDIFDLIDSKMNVLPLSNASISNQVYDHDDLSLMDVKDMVKSALLTYGADKTGSFDFALETAGGSVVSTRCTQMYTERLPSYTWFGVPVWLPLPVWGPATNPRTAIQPGVMPGECWAFKGSRGFLVIKLAMPMKPTRFSMEHIPKSLSPNGKIDSAPKEFLVLGLQEEKDAKAEELGTFLYDDNGEPLQFFDIGNGPRDYTYNFVELRILNNHGNDQYTCLYRFRVHGSP
jgi:hypothetical protein